MRLRVLRHGALSVLRAEYPRAGDVTAVVSLWGRLVPAWLGARAQHARIEALWLSRRIPAATAAAVAARYPAAALFRRRDAMLAEFPVSDLPSYRLGLWRWQYAVSVHVLTTAAAVVALVLVGRRAIESGGALHARTLEHALVWPHLQALLVALIMVVLGYGLLARRRRVPRLHRPVLGRWFGAPLLLGLGNAVLVVAAGAWAPAVALVCALCALSMLVTDLVPWVRLERAAPAALARRTRAVVGDRVLDTANTVAAGGLLVIVGALLPPGAAVAGFLLGWLAIITVVVVTLAQLVL